VLEYAPDLASDQLRGRMEELQPNLLVVRSTAVRREALAAARCLRLVLRAGAGDDAPGHCWRYVRRAVCCVPDAADV